MVTVHWLLINGTIERPIIDLCKYKQSISDSYLYDISERVEKAGLGIPELIRILNM